MRFCKGEIATATVIAIAVITFVGGFLFTKANPFQYFKSSKTTQSEKYHLKTELKEPVLLGDKIEFRTEKIDSKGNSVKIPKLTIWERITGFISSLSIWTIVFIVVSVVFFGGTPIIWAIGKYRSLKQTLKNTVSAIRETDEETYKKLKPVLSAKHDQKDKRIIDDIKKELH